MNIIQRIKASTPPFFAKLRNISLALAAVSTAIVAAPLHLPDIVVHISGYLGVAAAVAGAVSQAVVIDLPPNEDP